MRDLTQGMKGHLSPPVIGIYDGLTHEDLGVYEGTLDRETVFPLLCLETAADKLRTLEERSEEKLE